DGTVGVHGPEVVRLLFVGQVGVEDLLEGVLLDVKDPQIGGVAAAVVLAPPDHGVAVGGGLLAVGRVAAPEAPVGEHGLFQAGVDGDLVEAGDAGVDLAARRGEDDAARVTRPADDGVGGAVEGQLLRLAALGGDDVDVVVARAVRGEGEPL